MRWHGHRATLFSYRLSPHQAHCDEQKQAESTARKETNGMDSHHDLTPEQASRMSVTAVTADLEYWARGASVDGRVGLNDLTRALDVIRQASVPESPRP
jgi:hypothetical protein